MKIKVIDLGISNIQSVLNAFNRIEANISTCDNYLNIPNADAFVLPGVGAFDAAMKKLTDKKFQDQLYIEVIKKKKPILGICLGMQLLCSLGFENGKKTKGLSMIDANVKKLKINEVLSNYYKLPHIGWNEVNIVNDNGIFKGIPQFTDFYFIHSYFVETVDKGIISSYSNNGMDFTSAFEKENIFGVQFHPEKSQKFGLQLLHNWITLIKS